MRGRGTVKKNLGEHFLVEKYPLMRECFVVREYILMRGMFCTFLLNACRVKFTIA